MQSAVVPSSKSSYCSSVIGKLIITAASSNLYLKQISMLGRFDVTRLFATVEGRNDLLSGGKPFGVTIAPGEGSAKLIKNNTTMDLGILSRVNFRPLSYPPLGYEEGDRPVYFVEQEIHVHHRASVKFSNLVLQEVIFLPSNKQDEPCFQLLSVDYENPEGVRIPPNGPMHFHLQIQLRKNSFTGYLGKWMIMSFQVDEPSISRTVIRSSNFLVAIRLTGCIVSDAGPGGEGKIKLSVESRPFVPQKILNNFDSVVSIALLDTKTCHLSRLERFHLLLGFNISFAG